MVRLDFSENGIQPTKEKVEIIENLKKPKDLKGVRQVLGVINYYAKFILNLASIASPLYKLLQKNQKFKFTEIEEASLNKIKMAISQRNILKPFNTDSQRKLILKTDGSEEGMGAVLEQEQADGKIWPILYWSSKFRKDEQNYCILEKEALAIVQCVQKKSDTPNFIRIQSW